MSTLALVRMRMWDLKMWVFKFDIGASIGVGVSVGAEVDIGGMVDTVCDKAESAWQ